MTHKKQWQTHFYLSAGDVPVRRELSEQPLAVHAVAQILHVQIHALPGRSKHVHKNDNCNNNYNSNYNDNFQYNYSGNYNN